MSKVSRERFACSWFLVDASKWIHRIGEDLRRYRLRSMFSEARMVSVKKACGDSQNFKSPIHWGNSRQTPLTLKGPPGINCHLLDLFHHISALSTFQCDAASNVTIVTLSSNGNSVSGVIKTVKTDGTYFRRSDEVDVTSHFKFLLAQSSLLSCGHLHSIVHSKYHSLDLPSKRLSFLFLTIHHWVPISNFFHGGQSSINQ